MFEPLQEVLGRGFALGNPTLWIGVLLTALVCVREYRLARRIRRLDRDGQEVRRAVAGLWDTYEAELLVRASQRRPELRAVGERQGTRVESTNPPAVGVNVGASPEPA